MEQDKGITHKDARPLALVILDGIRKAVANAIDEHRKAGRDPREVQKAPDSHK